MTDRYEPSVTPRIYAPSISVEEHRKLRDAIDGANVSGTVTWIKNTAGVPVAAIVPANVAETGLMWENTWNGGTRNTWNGATGDTA